MTDQKRVESMADIEKVVRGLEICTADDIECDKCPYDGEGRYEYGCETVMKRDALELLKEKQRTANLVK